MSTFQKIDIYKIPYPEGATIGHDHCGWAIWEAIYLVSIVAGIIVERYKKQSDKFPI